MLPDTGLPGARTASEISFFFTDVIMSLFFSPASNAGEPGSIFLIAKVEFGVSSIAINAKPPISRETSLVLRV